MDLLAETVASCFMPLAVALVVVLAVLWQRMRRLETTVAELAALAARLEEGQALSARRESAAATSESPAAVVSPAAPEAPAAGQAPGSTSTPPPHARPLPAPAPVPPVPEPPPPGPPGLPPLEPPPPPPPEPPPAVSLEERLGARLPVWIGAVALALAVIFLVRYTFAQGWVTPEVRVLLGIGFGLALIAVGDRRVRSPWVAQGLAAAGVAALFASIWSAGVLYRLIPTPAAFAGLAATAIAGVFLALRLGPVVAVVGLVGGLLAPQLVAGDVARPGVLFPYLLLIQGSVLAIGRRRPWGGALAGAAFAGGSLWVLATILGRLTVGGGVELWTAELYVLVAAGLFAGAIALAPPARWGAGSRLRTLAVLAGGGTSFALLFLLWLIEDAPLQPADWGAMALLAAAALGLGRLQPRYALLPWVALAAAAPSVALWPSMGAAATPYLVVVAGFGALFAGGAFAASFGTRAGSEAGNARSWLRLSAVSAIVFALLALAARSPDAPGAGTLVAVAVLLAAGAAIVARRRGRSDRAEAAVPAPLVAAAAFLFAVAAFLDLETLSPPVLAFGAAALFGAAGALGWPLLARLGRGMTVAAAVLAVAAAWDLGPFDRWAVAAELLAIYGGTALGLAAAAVFARRAGAAGAAGAWRWARGLEWTAAGLAALYLGLAVDQLFEATGGTDATLFARRAVRSVAWLLLGLGGLALGRRLPETTAAAAGRAIVSLGGAQALFVSALSDNPLWLAEPVGRWLLADWLSVAYLVPALLLALAAARARPGSGLAESTDRQLVAAWRGGALVLVFVWVTLEVRHAFQGTYLAYGEAGAAESYAYSAAWILFGLALLAAGVARASRALRYASLVVMAVAVGKVFLYDTSHLPDLYRVVSFLGLGVALFLLASAYHRWVVPPGRGVTGE